MLLKGSKIHRPHEPQPSLGVVSLCIGKLHVQFLELPPKWKNGLALSCFKFSQLMGKPLGPMRAKRDDRFTSLGG